MSKTIGSCKTRRNDTQIYPQWVPYYDDVLRNNLHATGVVPMVRNDAARSFLETASHAPIGCHYYYAYYAEECDEWEVALFVSATEVVGGPRDRTIVPCRMQIDVTHLVDVFDIQPKIYWQTGVHQDEEETARHLSLKGSVRGRQVWLRVLAQAPSQAGPGRLLHALTGEPEDLWRSMPLATRTEEC